MASLGEISVDLKANTSQFDSAMKSAAGVMGKAASAAAGVAAGAAAIVGAAAAAGAATFALVKSVASLGDSAAKAASRMGTTAEVVQELQHAAEMSGGSVGDLEKAFTRVGKNALDAADGTKEAVDAFKRIGVEVKGANGELKTSEQLFMESADAISQMKNTTEQAAAAQEVFGKSGTKLLPLLKEGASGIANLRQEARDLGIVMSNDAAASSEHFNDTMDRLSKSFEGIKIQVGSALLPAFTKLADIVLGVTRRFFEQVDVAKYMQDGLKYLTQGALSLLDGLIEFAPVLAGVATAMRVASNMGQLWRTGLFAIGKVIAGLGATIAEFVTGALSGLVGGVGEVAVAMGQDKLGASLLKAEKGIADVARTMGGLAASSFDSLGDSVKSAATDFGDIDDAISDLASGSASSALRDTLGGIRDSVESIGSATLDTAKKFDSGADSMVSSAKKIESALKEVALAYADAFLAERQFGRDVGKARANEENRIQSGMGAAIANANEVRATSARGGAGIDTAAKASEAIGKLAEQSELASAGMSVMSGGVTGIVDVFVKLWSSSEKMAEVFELLDGAMAPLKRFIDVVGGDLVKVLTPVMGLFDALAPVLDLVLVAMNPLIIPLKLLGGLFKALAEPINWFITAIKKLVNGIDVFVRNIGRKAKNKAYVDDNGNIVDPKRDGETIIVIFDEVSESASGMGDAADNAAVSLDKLSEPLGRVAQQVKNAGDAFLGVFKKAETTFGIFGTSGYKQIWGDYFDTISSMTDAQGAAADAARDVAASLSNVPEIFRKNLRTSQATGASGSAAAAMSGIYVAGNIIVPGANPDMIVAAAQRYQFIRTGSAHVGGAAMGGLQAAG